MFVLFLPLVLLALACGPSDGSHGGGGAQPGVYDATGVVVSVIPEYQQVVLDHEDVPGLMPAMTMSFDVPDPAVLSGLVPGQRVAFRLQFTGDSYRVIEAHVVGQAGSRGTRLGISGAAPDEAPAPAFELVDHRGEPLALESLRGRTLLIDFVYTRCDGPCPIQTSRHVEVQQALPDDVKDRIHFVSISLDPAYDDAAALTAYAEQRGCDLERWSFLTGDVETVKGVLADYGVGLGATTGDQIEHMIITYLVDAEGVVVKRYLGMEHAVETVRDDLEKVARAADEPVAG